MNAVPLDPFKFRDPELTAKGEKRAKVALRALETLWFNTGTLCNLTCRNCYIESSPRNDRLAEALETAGLGLALRSGRNQGGVVNAIFTRAAARVVAGSGGDPPVP